MAKKTKKENAYMDAPIAYKPPKPSMTVKSTHIKGIKNMVGKKVKFVVTGKVKGVNEEYDNPKVHRGEVEIHSIKHAGKGYGKHLGGVVK